MRRVGRGILTAKKRPRQHTPTNLRPARDNLTIINIAPRLMQRMPKDCKENNRRNHTLKRKEILHLRVRNAQERQLQEEVQQEPDHPVRRDALVFGDVVRDAPKGGPYCGEEDGHALSAGCGLHAQPDDGEHAARDDDEVAEVVAEGHAGENGEGRVQLGESQSQAFRQNCVVEMRGGDVPSRP